MGETGLKTDAIHYADEEEKRLCRKLWHQAFPEDTEPFADYYYSEKTRDNRILVKGEEGELASMVQLNPYTLLCRGQEWKIDYIVGVATDKDRRHRGHMRELLVKMMEDMHREKVPFTFLMPADEAIYRPFRFSFIYSQPAFELAEAGRQLKAVACPPEGPLTARAAGFMEEWLREGREVYCKRDTAYVSRLIRELASENGSLDLLMDGEKPAALRAEWGLKEREQRLLYGRPPYVREIKEKEKPTIMARVTDVEAFFTMISGERAEEATAQGQRLSQGLRPDGILELIDPILPEQNGRFAIFITETGAWAERIPEGKRERGREAGEAKAAGETGEAGHGPAYGLAAGEGFSQVETLSMAVDWLPQWLFGYRSLDQLREAGLIEAIPQWAFRVRTIEGVFLDEVV